MRCAHAAATPPLILRKCRGAYRRALRSGRARIDTALARGGAIGLAKARRRRTHIAPRCGNVACDCDHRCEPRELVATGSGSVAVGEHRFGRGDVSETFTTATRAQPETGVGPYRDVQLAPVGHDPTDLAAACSDCERLPGERNRAGRVCFDARAHAGGSPRGAARGQRELAPCRPAGSRGRRTATRHAAPRAACSKSAPAPLAWRELTRLQQQPDSVRQRALRAEEALHLRERRAAQRGTAARRARGDREQRARFGLARLGIALDRAAPPRALGRAAVADPRRARWRPRAEPHVDSSGSELPRRGRPAAARERARSPRAARARQRARRARPRSASLRRCRRRAAQSASAALRASSRAARREQRRAPARTAASSPRRSAAIAASARTAASSSRARTVPSTGRALATARSPIARAAAARTSARGDDSSGTSSGPAERRGAARARAPRGCAAAAHRQRLERGSDATKPASSALQRPPPLRPLQAHVAALARILDAGRTAGTRPRRRSACAPVGHHPRAVDRRERVQPGRARPRPASRRTEVVAAHARLARDAERGEQRRGHVDDLDRRCDAPRLHACPATTTAAAPAPARRTASCRGGGRRGRRTPRRGPRSASRSRRAARAGTPRPDSPTRGVGRRDLAVVARDRRLAAREAPAADRRARAARTGAPRRTAGARAATSVRYCSSWATRSAALREHRLHVLEAEVVAAQRTRSAPRRRRRSRADRTPPCDSRGGAAACGKVGWSSAASASDEQRLHELGREQARDRVRRVRRRRVRAREHRRLVGERVHRRRQARAAVGAQAVGAQRVDGDEQHVAAAQIDAGVRAAAGRAAAAARGVPARRRTGLRRAPRARAAAACR